MQALYLKKLATDINTLSIEIVEKPLPILKTDDCLIKVAASGINPSDALAAIGYFKHAIFPRIPGRDFAGTVVDGPAHMLDKKVWGTGGAAGISKDGTQAEYIALSCSALAEIPSTLDLLTAAAQTLPFVTAYYSLVKRARLQATDTVLVVGALGQVGKAAMSICQWKTANAIALVQGKAAVARANQLGWNAIDSAEKNLAEHLLAATNGKTIDVIFNSLGTLYWQDFMQCLSEFGRIVTIGARENARETVINLFDLYRSNQEISGVNTAAFDFAENAEFLRELHVGFENNQLQPLDLLSTIYRPENAKEAYQAVMKGASQRVIIRFN